VAARPAGRSGRTGKARIAEEAASCPQPDEDLARPILQYSLQLDGVVACVEDEQGNAASHGPSPEQFPDLLRGERVSLLFRMDAPDVHRSGPALADEIELRDELVGPSGDDGLAGGVARWMIVLSSLGAALRVAALPHANVHSVDGRFPYEGCSGERMAGQELA
jgi:hypothetical protein